MLINMTIFNQFSLPNYPLSGYKVAYFRIPQWDKADKNGLINGNPPTLEICLIPDDMDIKSFDNDKKDVAIKEQAFAIPPEALIIKVRAGDDWPNIEAIAIATKQQKEFMQIAEKDRKMEEIEFLGHGLNRAIVFDDDDEDIY